MAMRIGKKLAAAGSALLVAALALATTSCGAEGAPAPRKQGEPEKPRTPRQRTEPGVGLTVYNSQRNQTHAYNPYAYGPYGYQYQYANQPQVPGWAVVKDWRRVRLEKGAHTVRFTDVAKQIDATTVNFESVTDPKDTSVVEQNYEFDLVNGDKILEKYIDKRIVAELEGGKSVAGRLLSFDPAQLVLDTGPGENPIQIVARGQNVRNIRFPSLPGGLITKPTLVWMVDAGRGGDHLVKVTYQTGGISWLADYNVIIDAKDTAADVSGWVTVNNQSGASYPDAELKLVAGDVHRAVAPGMAGPMEYASADAVGAKQRQQAGFTQKAFFEYHLYTLGRTTTIPDRSIKQIELFDPCRNVPARKVLVYEGAKGLYWYGGGMIYDQNYGVEAGNKKLSVYIEFTNDKRSGMGIPLPAGRARVYKADPDDGSLEFVGEDNIDHTPRDEEVRLKLGESFDVVGERRQTDYKYQAYSWVRESYEIVLRNHKDTDQDVLVIEPMYRWSNWIIEKISDGYLKKDSRLIHIPVKVPANGSKKITYTVYYTAYPAGEKGVEPMNQKELDKAAKEKEKGDN